MCTTCLGRGQTFQNGINSSLGDDGIAIKNNTKYDGSGNQDKKFEGEYAAASDNAKMAQDTGRQ